MVQTGTCRQKERKQHLHWTTRHFRLLLAACVPRRALCLTTYVQQPSALPLLHSCVLLTRLQWQLARRQMQACWQHSWRTYR